MAQHKAMYSMAQPTQLAASRRARGEPNRRITLPLSPRPNDFAQVELINQNADS